MAGVATAYTYGNFSRWPSFGGAVPRRLDVYTDVMLDGDASFGAPVFVFDGGRLRPNGKTLTLGDSLRVSGANAYLHMDVPNSRVVVAGHATFAGGNHEGKLTEGVLDVRGNLRQLYASDTRSFASTARHVTKLSGAAAQTVHFDRPNLGESRLATLQVDKSAGAVTLASTIYVDSTFDVGSTTTVAQTSGTLFLGKALTTVAGSDLSGINEVGTYANFRTWPTVDGAHPKRIVLRSDVALAASRRHTGALFVRDGGRLRLDGHSLTISDSIRIEGADAYLVMDAPNSTLLVERDATFAGGNHEGKLTAGRLEVQGNLRQVYAHDTRSFAGTGAHLVRLTGAANQTVHLDRPATNESRFASLEVNKSTGSVTVTSLAQMDSALTITSATALSASSLGVGKRLTTTTGDLSGVALVYTYGAFAEWPTLGAASTHPQRLELNTDVSVTGTATFAKPVFVRDGGRLRIAGKSLTLSDSLHVTGANAFLVMDVVGSQLVVVGNATFAGGNHDGKLTQGTLELRGNFRQLYAHDTRSFASTGAHHVQFGGSANQSAHFDRPAVNESRFAALTLQNGAGVTFTSNVFVDSAMTVAAGTAVTQSTGTLGLGKSLTTGQSSAMTGVAHAYTYGNFRAWPSFGSASYPQRFDVQTDVTLSSSASFGKPVFVLDGGRLRPSGKTLTLSDSLHVSGANAFLHMDVQGSRVVVRGNATFAGGNHEGKLTEGVLELQGNFTQKYSFDTRAFAATNNHVTAFTTTGARSVHFDRPALAESRFARVVIGDSTSQLPPQSAKVKFASNANVSGDLENFAVLDVDGGKELRINSTLWLRHESNTNGSSTGTITPGQCKKVVTALGISSLLSLCSLVQ